VADSSTSGQRSRITEWLLGLNVRQFFLCIPPIHGKSDGTAGQRSNGGTDYWRSHAAKGDSKPNYGAGCRPSARAGTDVFCDCRSAADRFLTHWVFLLAA
jgi:hypothetical protein